MTNEDVPYGHVHLLGILTVLKDEIVKGNKIEQAVARLDDDSKLFVLALCHRLARAYQLELHEPSVSASTDSLWKDRVRAFLLELDREVNAVA